jgi:hypothetical protein
MNKILKLARQHLMHERWSRYGESVEEDYYEFYPCELVEFVQTIVHECCEWIDNSPTTEDGQLIFTKSFIISNLKGYFEVDNNER